MLPDVGEPHLHDDAGLVSPDDCLAGGHECQTPVWVKFECLKRKANGEAESCFDLKRRQVLNENLLSRPSEDPSLRLLFGYYHHKVTLRNIQFCSVILNYKRQCPLVPLSRHTCVICVSVTNV